MWKSTADFLRSNVSKTKMCMWIIFAIHMVGIWTFQHFMIELTWADCNVTPATVVCLFLLLLLLPYSLSHKLRIKAYWYSLIFVPSIIVCTLVSNENFTLTSFIAAVVALVCFVWLVCKQPSLPGRPLANNLVLYLCIAVYSYVFANTDLLTHYKYYMMHLQSEGQYDESLEVGKKTLHVNKNVFELRSAAMLKTNTIGNKLFKYPVPNDVDTLQLVAGLNENQLYDAILCNLLLRKKLDDFVKNLQKWYDIKSPNLPRYYEEALAIYQSKTIDTNLAYDNASVQTNYKDFVEVMNRYSDRQVRCNMCRDMYPDTYFWYYFFFQRQK